MKMVTNEEKQVAVERTKPTGRILGIDIIPAQPPKGVSTIQGNFLSPAVQAGVISFLKDPEALTPDVLAEGQIHEGGGKGEGGNEELIVGEGREGVIRGRRRKGEEEGNKMVDVVLSDMSAPWAQTEGFWKRTLSDPYHRMMNTCGIGFRDHAGSMVCFSLSFPLFPPPLSLFPHPFPSPRVYFLVSGLCGLSGLSGQRALRQRLLEMEIDMELMKGKKTGPLRSSPKLLHRNT